VPIRSNLHTPFFAELSKWFKICGFGFVWNLVRQSAKQCGGWRIGIWNLTLIRAMEPSNERRFFKDVYFVQFDADFLRKVEKIILLK